MKTTIAVDNGCTGSIAIISPAGTIYTGTPTKDALHYSKKGGTHQRIDHAELELMLQPYMAEGPHVYLERPFTAGPMMINTSLLSARAFEATLIVLERLEYGYTVVDSREWQKALLPGVTGSANLKKASRLKGLELYPELGSAIKQQGDADGLLIAHYYHGKG